MNIEAQLTVIFTVKHYLGQVCLQMDTRRSQSAIAWQRSSRESWLGMIAPPLGILLAERTTAVSIAIWVGCLVVRVNTGKPTAGAGVYLHAVGAAAVL